VTGSDKVLVVGPSWVGDMVMAQTLYKLLRRQDPQVEIHVVAPPWSLPVLERMPEVARGIELAVGHGEVGLGRRWSLARQLRAERYARAIVLPRSAKAALVPWLAHVPLRTGFRGEWRYGLLNDVQLDARLDGTVKRFVALGHEMRRCPQSAGGAEPGLKHPSTRTVARDARAHAGRASRHHAGRGGRSRCVGPPRTSAPWQRLGADADVVARPAKERSIGDEVVVEPRTRASGTSAAPHRWRTSWIFSRPPT
jgi:hypothetical protein